MSLRTLARGVALRAARALLLPELREALGEPGSWPELLDVCSHAAGNERRILEQGAERDAAVGERDALRLELAEHRQALEEVRGRLAAEQRQTALVLAQRDAQKAIVDAAVKVGQGLREAGERAKAAAAHCDTLTAKIDAAHVVLEAAGTARASLVERVKELDGWRREAHRRAREAEERLRAAQLAAEGGR